MDQFDFFPIEFSKDRYTFMQMVVKKPSLLTYFRNVSMERELLMEVLERNPQAAEYLEQIKNDHELMEMFRPIVELQNMSLTEPIIEKKELDEWSSEKKSVMSAVKLNVYSLKNFPQMWNDRDIIKQCAILNCYALFSVTQQVIHDIDLVLTVIPKDDQILKFASKSIRYSREVVLQCVKLNGLSLAHASNELQDDEEIVMEASLQNHHSFRFASKRLRKHYNTVLKLVKRNGLIIPHAGSSLSNNHTLVLEACKQNGMAIQFFSVCTREIAMAAVSQNGLALPYVPLDWQTNREIVLAAVRQNVFALELSCYEEDLEMRMEAVVCNGYSCDMDSECLYRWRLEKCYPNAMLKQTF